MRDLIQTSRTERHRKLGSRDYYQTKRNAHASAEISAAKMALTCKVQFMDDTDPFATTILAEPSRPPTYTFHLNIPLCQQLAGLHRLLCAPHAVCKTNSLLLSCSGLGLFWLWKSVIADRRCRPPAVSQSLLLRFRKYVRGASRFTGWISRQVCFLLGLIPYLILSWPLFVPFSSVGYCSVSNVATFLFVSLSAVYSCSFCFPDSRKNSIIERTSLSVRVHNCIGKYFKMRAMLVVLILLVGRETFAANSSVFSSKSTLLMSCSASLQLRSTLFAFSLYFHRYQTWTVS